MRYVLLCCGAEDEAGDETRMELDRWFAEHAASIVHSRWLKSALTATTIDASFGPDLVAWDGPFSTPALSGYIEVEAADLDEVLRMVRTWPGSPTVEIRPLVTL
ncbi:YciI family protein [[Actinomadura] parvosata]|uniref:YciI family protein n=1 Tax=[Actinomadura] parvosata TaxID=1955412 RepID=UPI00406BF1B8